MSGPVEPFTPYHRKLFVFLSVATFFEGYDFIALSQLLPELRRAMHLDRDAGGYLVAFITFGSMVAFGVVRQVDRWGRRRVLSLTIAGYTLFTFLSALSPNVYIFAVAQLLARVFLIAEWAVTAVVAAEEFPDSRRGQVLGVLQATSALGAIVCAGLVPALVRTALGWRSVYLVGIVPLLLVAFFRRTLRETRRYEAQSAEARPTRGFFHLFRTPYRTRVFQIASIWFVAYLWGANGVTFWKDFAVNERGLSAVDVSNAIKIAALGSMPLVFMAGRLLDWIGRRRGAIVIFGTGAAGTFGCFTLHGFWPLTAALVLGIFASTAFFSVLIAFTTELFPTDLRGDAFAWTNNVLGRIGAVLSPGLIGLAATRVGGYGPVLAATAVFPLLTVVMIYAMLPETRGKNLEETARL